MDYCDCGCGRNLDDEFEGLVTITLEDDTEIDCDILAGLELEGIHYMALLTREEIRDVLVYRVEHTEDGLALENIESEEELDTVYEAFDEMFFEDFENLFSEMDEDFEDFDEEDDEDDLLF